MSKKLLAYVSGPIRDERGTWYVEQNNRAADEVAVHLWQMGYAVICPHANSRHFDGAVSNEDFIKGDLVIVERCDLIVMLPNWARSRGACQELMHAGEHRIPAYLWPLNKEELRTLAEAQEQLQAG